MRSIVDIFFNEIILSGIASVVSSVITWRLAKRKYNSEVDSNEINNLKESLKIYKEVIEDNQKLLKEYMDKVDEGLLEIHNLRKAVTELLNISCVDSMCLKRKYLADSDVKKLLNIDY